MRWRSWLFLLAAVAAEVVGVTVMKQVSASGSLLALLFMYGMIGLSFALLAGAMTHLPMALAYAAWEALGLASIAFIGFRYFGESLGPLKLLGLAVLLAGVVLVNVGSARQQEA